MSIDIEPADSKQPYPGWFSRRVLASYYASNAQTAQQRCIEAAETHKVSTSSVRRWVDLEAKNGSVDAKPKSGGRPSVVTDQMAVTILLYLGMLALTAIRATRSFG